jgi:hypothetical protein
MLTSTLPFLFLFVSSTFEQRMPFLPQNSKHGNTRCTSVLTYRQKPGEKQLDIGFRIAKNTTDVKDLFPGAGPEGMPLGELYYHFINDYNDTYSETTIEYVSADLNRRMVVSKKAKMVPVAKILIPIYQCVKTG